MGHDQIATDLKTVESNIIAACSRAHRSREEVQLVAATKYQPIDSLLELYNLGIRDFGENRVQDLTARVEQLPSDVRWHFIGHLQSNKARQIATFVHLVHSIDKQDTAKELSRRAELSQREIEVLIEINISGELTKSGVSLDGAEELLVSIQQNCPGLVLRGLMGMASYEENPEKTRPQFESLRLLQRSLQQRHPDLRAFTELSMGMSNDYEIAIEEGATIIRVGSALFQ